MISPKNNLKEFKIIMIFKNTMLVLMLFSFIVITISFDLKLTLIFPFEMKN